MVIHSFIKGFAIGIALGGLKDYICSREVVKQYLAKHKAKKQYNWLTGDETGDFLPSTIETTVSEPIITVTPEEEEDLPWTYTPGQTTGSYKRLNDILESEEYKLDVEPNPDNYIPNSYSEVEMEAIYEAEAELAEEEHPEDDEPTDEELAGYYIPDEDLYDENTYEPDDEGPPIENKATEIDEDEFENCPYNGEVYFYYGPSSTIIDEEDNYIGSDRDDWILELFGTDTFSELKSRAEEGKDNIIFIRNDSAEIAYKVIYVNEEYDK